MTWLEVRRRCAFETLDSCLIMKLDCIYHCTFFSALLLYTKCRVASAPSSGEARTQVLQSSCTILESVKKHFQKIGAQSRLLETWYFQVCILLPVENFVLDILLNILVAFNNNCIYSQAQLYNEIGNIGARNQCAWMYRQLETQDPVEQSNAMLMMY